MVIIKVHLLITMCRKTISKVSYFLSFQGSLFSSLTYSQIWLSPKKLFSKKKKKLELGTH
jgi:hypothetical protein